MDLSATAGRIPDDAREGAKMNARTIREDLRERAEWMTEDGDQDWSDDTMVVRWKSSGKIVPPRIFEEAFLEVPSGQVEQYEKQKEKELQEYREAQANRSEEEVRRQRDEARRALGDGPKINVLTGERFE